MCWARMAGSCSTPPGPARAASAAQGTWIAGTWYFQKRTALSLQILSGTNLEPLERRKCWWSWCTRFSKFFLLLQILGCANIEPLDTRKVADHGAQGFLNSFYYYRSLLAKTFSPLTQEVLLIMVHRVSSIPPTITDHCWHKPWAPWHRKFCWSRCTGFPQFFLPLQIIGDTNHEPLESVGVHGSQSFLNSFFFYRSFVAQTLSPLKGVADHGA